MLITIPVVYLRYEEPTGDRPPVVCSLTEALMETMGRSCYDSTTFVTVEKTYPVRRLREWWPCAPNNLVIEPKSVVQLDDGEVVTTLSTTELAERYTAAMAHVTTLR